MAAVSIAVLSLILRPPSRSLLPESHFCMDVSISFREQDLVDMFDCRHPEKKDLNVFPDRDMKMITLFAIIKHK